MLILWIVDDVLSRLLASSQYTSVSHAYFMFIKKNQIPTTCDVVFLSINISICNVKDIDFKMSSYMYTEQLLLAGLLLQ